MTHCKHIAYSLFVFCIYILGVILDIHDSDFEKAVLLAQTKKLDRIKNASHDLDDVINFRVSSVLKDEFNKICKDDQSTISRELKRYMLSIVKQGSL